MAKEISAVLDRVINSSAEDRENLYSSQPVHDYMKLCKIIRELDTLKRQYFNRLSDVEKDEVFNKQLADENIPRFLPVRDVAMMLDISPQMVRRYCADGHIKAHQRFKNHGNWLIEASQFAGHPNWNRYVTQRKVDNEKNIKMAEVMLDGLEEK
ncbi:helix-turn-helix domain-containing protein [Sporolactobacillus sp. Y61]|uniref:Helix-turn-helix domain-containing protein n=1 Tax=Sporolactobacillus sp. Y61 TaxID=3160863 RepID=A0AAU8IIE2_9BACL